MSEMTIAVGRLSKAAAAPDALRGRKPAEVEGQCGSHGPTEYAMCPSCFAVNEVLINRNAYCGNFIVCWSCGTYFEPLGFASV